MPKNTGHKLNYFSKSLKGSDSAKPKYKCKQNLPQVPKQPRCKRDRVQGIRRGRKIRQIAKELQMEPRELRLVQRERSVPLSNKRGHVCDRPRPALFQILSHLKRIIIAPWYVALCCSGAHNNCERAGDEDVIGCELPHCRRTHNTMVEHLKT